MREGRNRTIDYCRKNSESCEQTGIGAIPHEWALRPLTEFAQQERNAFSNGPFGSDLLSNELQTQGVPVIYIRDISRYVFNWRSRVYVSDQKATQLSAFSVRFGDVLITKVGSPPCEAAVYNKDVPSVITQDVIRLRPSKGVDSYFLMLMINSLYAQREVRKIKIEGTRERVSLTDFKKIKLPFPPLPEQQKIAAILSTWDEAIEKTQSLIDQLRQRNKGLAQQLLTGKKRLPAFAKASDGEETGRSVWKNYSYGQILKRVRRPVIWDDAALYNLISVRRRSRGIFFRDALYGYQIKVKNLQTARTGDFLFSKMQIVHGASALVTSEFDNSKISGSYISVRTKDETRLSMEFLNWYSKLPEFYHQTYVSSYGVHIEKMTFDFDSFMTEKIRLPERKEQNAIVAILNESKKELELYQNKLFILQKQKKGLMQKLLTGEIRVNTTKKS